MTNAVNFITVDIWRLRLEDLPFGKSFAVKQLRIILLALRGFDEDRCFSRAASLTFNTLLSIVPVVAILFGVAKGFGFEKLLEQRLFENFPGQEEILTSVISFSNSLLEQTKGGLIAGIGVAVLFWSVLKVLGHIENALNKIWEIRESRSWGRKISDYLSVMLIAPMLILMSGSITVFITTQITQITQKVTWLEMLSPLIYFSFNLIPYFLIWVLFTVVYVLMPNTKVKIRGGILAGIIAGTIFQIFQGVYIEFQIGVARYNAIYGSFAALPLFLFWVQISWWIVLFGAELSFASQNVRSYEYDPDSRRISPAFKKLLMLQVTHLLVHHFKNGKLPLTAPKISKRLAIPIRLLHQVLYELTTAGLLNETRTKSENQFGYQPARDINDITIGSVLEAIDHNGVDNIPVSRTAELEVLSDSMAQFSQAMESSPANKLLKDI